MGVIMYKIRTLNAISDVIYDALSKEEYIVSENQEDSDAILVRSASMHNVTLPPSLCAIARAGAGFNNIPVAECSKAGIVVFNTPGANANAVKESVLTGLLLGTRDIVGGIEWARTLDGKGDDIPKLVEKGKNQFTGPELKGKTLAIMGLGAVGGPVANTAYHLGMEIIGYDPYISVEAAWSLSRAVKRATSYEMLLENADYLSIHIPLADNTRGLINFDMLNKMKRGGVILNFSRGEVVDDDAVKAALKSGQLRKYITDFPNQNLLKAQGVLCIPHLGASTPESEENCAEMAAQQIDKYLKTGSIVNSVNFPRCELDVPEKHRVAVVHDNVPSMIGQITLTVGGTAVNIEHMVNKSRDTIAYTVLDTEAAITEETAEKLRAISGVTRVRVIA